MPYASREKRTAYMKEYARTHPEIWAKAGKRYYESHKEMRRAAIALNYQALKDDVLNHYGARCVCCGEEERVFLAIDHVNNDGGEQRKKLGRTGSTFLRWVRKNGYPDDLQVLCHNCNHAKRMGKCPHTLVSNPWADGVSSQRGWGFQPRGGQVK